MPKKQNGIAGLVGKSGSYTVPIRTKSEKPLKINVIITDAKQAFGRTDVKIEPEAGSGSAWVSKEHVQI